MSFSVNTNIASLTAQNYLRTNSDFQSKTITRVTSGLRIVSSGDDAAGLAIANGFRSDQAVLTQGIRNANDGLSTLQTIDGGMNNISQLLDRARTLATQSASGTFTGDRNVLNNEFTSVINEIDRQAQAIGLDQNGQFAKALSVFIGGGKAHPGSVDAGAVMNTNGSVSVDLSQSTVDAKSLGLKGVQATGASTDISAGKTTSVQAILADASNKTSIGNGNITNFYFAGPAFADQNKVQIQVNLNGVTDTNTLAAAINTAIQNAGNGSTSAATAFRNSGIAATVVTDGSGQHLAFNSSTTAFQVEAGDQMANALMGNTIAANSLAGGQTVATGHAVTTTVTAGGAAQAGAVGNAITVRVQGAGVAGTNGANYRDITLAAGNSITDLQSLVNNDAALKAAGISLTTATAGQALQFTSARGEKFTVQTSGDLSNVLGLGSYQINASTQQFDYSKISGGAFASAALMANANLNFSFNGQGSAATFTGAAVASAQVDTAGGGTPLVLDLKINGNALTVDFTDDTNQSATESVANVAAYINRVAAQNGYTQSIATTTTTTAANDTLVLTSSTQGSNSALQVVSGGTLFGLGSAAAAAGVTGSGANTVHLSIGTSGTLTGGAAPVLAGGTTTDTLYLKVDGGTEQALTLDDTKTIGQVADQINSQLKGAVASIVGGNLVFTSNSVGTGSGVALSTSTDATGGTAAALLKIDTASTPTAAPGTVTATAVSITDQLSRAFSTDSVLQAAGMQANIVSGKITISSTNGTFFRLGASYGSLETTGGSNPLTVMAGATGLGFLGSAGSSVANASAAAASSVVNAGGASQSVAYDFSALLNGNDDQTITISANDKSGVQQSLAITLRNDDNGDPTDQTSVRNSRNIDETLNTINKALQASNVPVLQNLVAVKDNAGGSEKVRFLSTDNSFTVAVGANASGAVDGFSLNSKQGTADVSIVSDGGSTADISTQGAAQNAVTALATAVSSLGNAQAAVGKGQNNFNYAINLAQSQLTNLAAAESRIRDADLAQEAANLTKAQILLQAGTAALAQANSAPQVVLSLLKG